MKKRTRQRRAGGMMVAVVLGTALSVMNTAEAGATSVKADETVIRDISRYCQACWRNAKLPQDDWTDCTQEVFIRLMERVEPTKWTETLRGEGDERRELVRAIDAVKKRTQRRRKPTALPEDVRDHRNAETARNRDWDQINRISTKALSARQQRIIALSRDGWTVPEIAEELDTTPQRVSDEKYKAIRKLQKGLSVEG